MIEKNKIEDYVRLIYDSVKSSSKYDGGLNKKEFLKFMKLMNSPVGFFERKKIFCKYDVDDNGTVDYDEIMKIINFKQQRLLCTEN